MVSGYGSKELRVGGKKEQKAAAGELGRGGEVGLLISKVLSWGGRWRGLARGWGWDGVEFGPEADEATVWRLTFYSSSELYELGKST